MPRRLMLVVLALLLVWPAALPTAADDPAPAADDPRVGTVSVVQGSALVRPGGRRRWTPLAKDAVLLPGDLVRVRTRGAHALDVALASDGALLAGPGALLEASGRGRLRLLRGDVEIRAGKDAPVLVEGTGDFRLEVKGTAWLRAGDDGVERLEKAPRWLEGYRASTGEEWMGSLLANVDGRNVPLAVGYHKVTVDVRDQIARTTVEQSFVNTTDARLEGVFFFPLPADASISGFGMWIGGELVEADVVEKARARQIYEDILRRKKDPGLLEWQGGNLFKARVFPIEPHSEKRVRVRYTQVLRLEGETWRYRYALRSDLLRAKPLRELDIQVNVLSTRAIADVQSPTHACRVTNTGHTARVEFDAEEYVPTRDLEIAVTLAPSPGMTVVTNRRGDEGWFMVLLTPPGEETRGWTRELMPDGDPLEVVVVADTSGSMDAKARETQAEFIASLLSLLGEEDRFRLATADVGTHWAFDGARPATEANAAEALAFLDARTSLGWTDLDGTLDAALSAATDGALVVYVGDGIPTTMDADPSAQADRLRLRGAATGAQAPQVTVHAVAASSTYEQPVLEALASIGGGSVRRADSGAAAAAYALLSDAARPLLRNVEVEVTGVPTARVYPSPLPNLPVGSQQVVLGRFQPSAEAQVGQVVVTGTLDGETVTYRAPLTVPVTDEGNSFLPRLWARKHLDVLMAEGSSAAVQEDIVAFSAEYGILTPYTSLLVLESDADRERYGVDRTVKMRDGESFFAQGHDAVALEMKRAQAKKARAWRIGLRRRMLREIRGLGRDLLPDQTAVQLVALGEVSEYVTETAAIGVGGGAGGRFRGGVPVERLRSMDKGLSAGDEWGAPEPVLKDAEIADHVETDNDLPFEESLGEEGLSDAPFSGPSTPSSPSPSFGSAGRARRKLQRDDFAREDRRAEEPLQRGRGGSRGGYRPSQEPQAEGGELLESKKSGYFAGRGGRRHVAPSGLSVQGVGFPPALPVARLQERKRVPAPWPQDVIDALKSLDRRERAVGLVGGVEILRTTTHVHAVRGDATGAYDERVLAGSGTWYQSAAPDLGARVEAWSDATHRVRLDAYRRLGRRRAVLARDREDVPVTAGGLAYEGFESLFRRTRVRVEGREGARVHLVIEGRLPGEADRHLRIDVQRCVILEERTVVDGLTVHRVRNSGFVEAGGLWWPRLTEAFDAYGRKVSFAMTQVTALDRDAYAAALAAATAGHEDVLFLDGDAPSLEDARRAASAGSATLADHLVVALEAANQRRWPAAFAAWDRAVKAAAPTGTSPLVGDRWVELVFLASAREGARLEEATSRAAAWLESAGDPAFASWWARSLYALSRSGLGAEERLALLARLRAPWTAELERRLAVSFGRAHVRALDAAGKAEAARAGRARILERVPYDLSAIRARVQDLRYLGESQAALDLLASRLAPSAEEIFTWEEKDALLVRLSDGLWARRTIADLASLRRLCAAWTRGVSRSEHGAFRLASVHFLNGEAEAVDRRLLEILAAPVSADPRSMETARLRAALRLALGGGWNFSSRGVEPQFVPALVDLGRRIGRMPVPATAPYDLFASNYAFRQADGTRRLREGLLEDLLAGIAADGLSPRRFAFYAARLPWGRNAVDADVFDRVVERQRGLWQTLPSGRDKDLLGDSLLSLYEARGDEDTVLAFLRARRDAATEDFRTLELDARLFDRCLQAEYSPEREDEVLALLPALLDPATPSAHALTTATSVRRLASWAFEGRKKKALGTSEERAGLTRAEAQAREREAATAAAGALATRLRAARDVVDPSLGAWLELERLGYAAESGEDPVSVEAAARELLADVPKDGGLRLDRVRAERLVLILDLLAVGRRAPEGLADRVLALFDACAADEADERLDWHFEVFRLLAALGRTEALEARLRTWVARADARTVWRIALGYVLAADGRLAEAAAQFESVASKERLSARNAEALANWYLALDDDVRREVALERRMEVLTENELSSLLRQLRSKVTSRRGGAAGDLEAEDFRLLRWAVRKTAHPQNLLWQVRTIYEATKDHRVLEALAAGLPGHTREGVYGFLRNATPLVQNVHEEATVDAAVAALEGLLARTPAEEARPVHLLIAMLRGRAALVRKTDPAQLAGALAALRRVGEGDFVPGERRLVAAVLVQGGRVQHAELARARVALMQHLLALEPKDSPHRVHLEDAYAQILWAHEEKELALDVWSAALVAERARTAGRLVPSARGVFDRTVNALTYVKRYRAAETELQAEEKREPAQGRRTELVMRRFQLYAQAIDGLGALAIGRGEALLDHAMAAMDAWLVEGPPAQAGRVVQAIVNLHRAAKKSGSVPEAGTRLEAWAREQRAAWLERLVIEATSMQDTVASAVNELVGPTNAVAYALDGMDAEPSFFERINLTLWVHVNWELARWRKAAHPLDEGLAKRLLPRVVASLEIHLRGRGRTGRSFWDKDYDQYWREKSNDFAAAAHRCAELYPSDVALQRRSAAYLHEIGRVQDAIGVLLAARARGHLDDDGHKTLAHWLVSAKRFEEALAVIDGVRERRPDDLQVRLLVSRALHGLGRSDEALAILKDTEARWRARKAWKHGVAWQLGERAFEQSMVEAADGWLEEAVRLRSEQLGGRVGNDSTLGRYYSLLARTRVALGRTDDAVDAASAGVVAWGGNHRRRARAIDALKKVLLAAKDLEAWRGRYDARVEETGLDAPLLRKTLAAAYAEKGQHAAAVRELLLARDLAPEDAEIHTKLVEAYDAIGEAEGAIDALLASLRMAPRNLAAAASLAVRYEKAGRESDAERARTNLVEPLPHEAEGHRRLAVIREAQKRLPEAEVQWNQTVRTDPLDPTGWLSLAKARIALGNVETAKAALDHVLKETWEARFKDVKKEAATLLSTLP